MDIESHFKSFVEKISIEETSLNEKIVKWKQCLEQKNIVEFVRRSASFKRGSSPNFVYYIDFVVLFDEVMMPIKDIKEFLKKAKNEVNTCFPSISDEEHGFRYSAKDFIVDIVVGFSDSINPLFYWVPARSKKEFVWVQTNAISGDKRINDVNRLTRGRAADYVKLLKFWNAINDEQFMPFHLETLIISKILQDTEKFIAITYGEGIKYLFTYLSEVIEKTVKHPTKKAPNLGDYDQNHKRHLKNLLLNMSGKVTKALKEPDTKEALSVWKSIFGPDFED